jgi:hypothetical protein
LANQVSIDAFPSEKSQETNASEANTPGLPPIPAAAGETRGNDVFFVVRGWMKTSVWLGLSLSASLVLASLDARAQAPPPAYYPPPWYTRPDLPRPFPVRFVGDTPERRFWISREWPFAYCIGRCDTFLYPGSYWLTVPKTATTASGRTRVRLEGPSTVRIHAADVRSDSRLAPVGFGLMLGGLAALVWAVAAKDSNPTLRGMSALGGIGASVTGIVFLIVGGATGPSTEPEVSVESAK